MSMGRMAWDKPAPTIKRECAMSENGDYFILSRPPVLSAGAGGVAGLSNDFVVNGAAVSNMYGTSAMRSPR